MTLSDFNIASSPARALKERKFKMLLISAVILLVWALLVHIAATFIKESAEHDWQAIRNETNAANRQISIDIFRKFQASLLTTADGLAASESLRKNLERNDSRKLFEELLKNPSAGSVQTEIYNSKLDLIAFRGRKLESDIYSLQRALKGARFSVLKEIGFFTYLIVYTPVYSDKNPDSIEGVLLCASNVNIKDQIGKRFLTDETLLKEIESKTKSNVQLEPADVISGRISHDSISLANNIRIDIRGIDESLIGYLFLNDYSQLIHLQNIEALRKKMISGIVFGLTVVVFVIAYRLSGLFARRLPKFILFIAVLVLIRYLWLKYSFPSAILNLEIFSPGDYASTFGFGVAKSLGDLFITSFFVLLTAFFGFFITVKGSSYIELTSQKEKRRTSLIKITASVILYFAVIYVFGLLVESIVYDSNLQFFDKSNVIPASSNFVMNLALLFFSMSMFLFLISLVMISNRKMVSKLLTEVRFRKFSYMLLLAVLLLVNFSLAGILNGFNIEDVYRLIIILLSFSFGIYLSVKLYVSKSYNAFTLKNLSLLLIFCIIAVPGILLDKLTSKETRYVELIGGMISEKEDDRVKFLLVTELSKLSDSKRIESELNDKSKQQELAFSVWSDSKFSEESFNTAVLVTDTNRRKKSDFIFGPASVETDSVLAYVERSLFRSMKPEIVLDDSTAATDSLLTDEVYDEEELMPEFESDEPEDMISADRIRILKNDLQKYYVGVAPLEIINLRGTEFETRLGYIIMAVEYDSKNYLLQASSQLFRNYSGDKLFDKLISTPVITEYIGGEIVGSTNRELSKENTTSLNAFLESVKNKQEKSGWRYETINNEKYRTYYILASPEELTLDERIFAISLRRNDVKLIIFFYLKFILFTVIVYSAVLGISFLLILTRLRSLRLNFREKLFASFLLVSVIPLIFLAIYTRTFIKDKYDDNFRNQLISDLSLVSQGLKSGQFGFGKIDSLNAETEKILSKSIQQSDKNFNIFAKYRLAATTDEELYKSDLIDTRVDADAFYNVYIMKKDYYSKTKEVGPYSFIVGFRPLFDSRNSIIGLISSQTVYKQNLLNEELTEILTFIFGSYIIVIILLLILVTFMTERISKPILRLQLATERIAKGESNVVIDVESKDEIGKLVESFNKMSTELENSKQQLKRAEREAAWRDIARRVAHEIKNPLTPMKLSIQHLQEMYITGRKEEFAGLLKKTKDIIIKEIDKLNHIASEFSDFAKMPRRNYERTSINEVIEEVVSLYSRADNVTFRKSLDPSAGDVWADKQELNRVFQNLIKNSLQAIEENGLIEVKTYRDNGKVVAEIKDNGTGIDPGILEHLFIPNFSTKSTGMGLGLAITKKSLDDMKAEIRFLSNPGRGTTAIMMFIPLNGSKAD